LRWHGYEPRTLKSRVGYSLSDALWKTGDLVAVSSTKPRDVTLSSIGRVCDAIKSPGTTNRSQRYDALSSKVTVEFYDSSVWRNHSTGHAATQRISGLVSSLPINNFSPTSLVFAGLSSGLFRSNNSKVDSSDKNYVSMSDILGHVSSTPIPNNAFENNYKL